MHITWGQIRLKVFGFFVIFSREKWKHVHTCEGMDCTWWDICPSTRDWRPGRARGIGRGRSRPPRPSSSAPIPECPGNQHGRSCSPCSEGGSAPLVFAPRPPPPPPHRSAQRRRRPRRGGGGTPEIYRRVILISRIFILYCSIFICILLILHSSSLHRQRRRTRSGPRPASRFCFPFFPAK